MPPTKLPSFAREPIFVTLSAHNVRTCQKPRLAKNLWVSVKTLDKTSNHFQNNPKFNCRLSYLLTSHSFSIAILPIIVDNILMTNIFDTIEITREQLASILNDWSFWDKPIPSSFERKIKLPSHLSNDLALVIQGVRRAGKSTIMQQLIAKYRLDPKDCVFINFEDPRLSSSLNFHLLEATTLFLQEERKNSDKLYFFFDEIQNVEGWQKWLHTKLERPSNCHFIISGSNAKMLSGELSTSLTGRYQKVEIFPFSYNEFQKVHTNSNLETYLQMGGFPRAIQTDNPSTLLREYYDNILEKDVREKINARSIQSLRNLVRIVYESCGSELSLRRLAGLVGLTADSVGSYLESAESAYLLFSCPYFAFSEKKRIQRNVKYYAVDTGLRNSVITRTGQDLGKNFENLVYLSLRKEHREVYYWRGKGEVDFVINNEDGITPIQVSFQQIEDRHERALEEFYSMYPKANEALLITAEDFSCI